MRLLKLLIGIVPLLASCAGGGTPSLPRPTAYPRPNLPDTAMCIVEEAPLVFAANAQAVVTSPRAGWFDIVYPSLGTIIHLTFTETEDAQLEGIKENRMQRLMLNDGEGAVDFAEFTNPAGFDIMTASAEESATPFQFLATDNRQWVVSGAVYLSDPNAPFALDSIRPIVNAVRRDMVKSLNSLNYK